jgi:hypothetical protein
VALLNAVSLARRARLHFRPLSESDDGKGEIAFKGMEQRAGRPLEGTIKLHEAPVPGEEYTLRLRAKKQTGGYGYEAEQTALARQGVHGMSLPFRFDIPATAPASGATWLLDFGPRGKKFFRSKFEVKLGEAPESEIRRASAHEVQDQEEPVVQAAAPTWGTSSSASLPPEAAAQPAVFETQRNRELFEHIEKLANAFGKEVHAAGAGAAHGPGQLAAARRHARQARGREEVQSPRARQAHQVRSHRIPLVVLSCCPGRSASWA